MSLATAPRRTQGGLRNLPTPLNMTLLAVPGASNPHRRSSPRPSIKESVAALGLGYSLSSSGLPGLSDVPSNTPLPRPLPRIPGSQLPRSSPKLTLDISSATSSEYTTTDTSASSFGAPPPATPPQLTRPNTLSLPHSLVHEESADVAIRPLPSPSPSKPSSPLTPALLSPPPVRRPRRWGITIFPKQKPIRPVPSAPASPIVFNNPPFSPSSIIAIKSPVEWRNSKRISDMFSLMTPFVVPFPGETDAPPVPPIPAWVVPPRSVKARIPPVPALPPVPKGPPPGISTGIPLSVSIPEVTLGKWGDVVMDEVSDPPVKAGVKQRRPSQVRPIPGTPIRRTNSHHKRTASTRRWESSTGRPLRRLMLKRDSGAPFTDHAVSTAAPVVSLSFAPSRPEEVEAKEDRRRSPTRWSASRKFLQMSNRKAKATVVRMRRGKEETVEKDIVAVIPQLRELKAGKRSRW